MSLAVALEDTFRILCSLVQNDVFLVENSVISGFHAMLNPKP